MNVFYEGVYMDKEDIIKRLISKTKLSYEECKDALEKTDYDILDAVVFLENEGKIYKPQNSEYYTNLNYKKNEVLNFNAYENKSERKNSFEGIFEFLCDLIDRFNNIYFRIKRQDKLIVKFPLTVMILLIIFAFWGVVPLAIVGLFFDIEYDIYGKSIKSDNKVNEILKKAAKEIQYKKKIMKDRR